MDMSIPVRTLVVVACAFFLTLVLAGLLTPRSWWRRLTAGNAVLVVGGTWALAAALLFLFPAPALPKLSPGAYRVEQALNLRASHGTWSRRLGVVPAGATIHATGQRAGDWWQLRANVDGRPLTGWSNSLWLRRTDEARADVDVREHAN